MELGIAAASRRNAVAGLSDAKIIVGRSGRALFKCGAPTDGTPLQIPIDLR